MFPTGTCEKHREQFDGECFHCTWERYQKEIAKMTEKPLSANMRAYLVNERLMIDADNSDNEGLADTLRDTILDALWGVLTAEEKNILSHRDQDTVEKRNPSVYHARLPTKRPAEWPKAPNGEPAKNAEDLAWAIAQDYGLAYASQVNLEADIGLMVYNGLPLETAYDIADDLVMNLTQYERDNVVRRLANEQCENLREDFLSLEDDAAAVVRAYEEGFDIGDFDSVKEAIEKMMSNGRPGWWKEDLRLPEKK
jgi:hypothetical protein